MQFYIARRALLFLPTMVILSLLVFLFLRIIPGDPAELVGQVTIEDGIPTGVHSGKLLRHGKG